ncbi:MAG: hypothetical protein WA584_00285 [Pyrinomonadaceae bacterium]
MSDSADYDNFATQFAKSLTKEGRTGDGNWFGRLVKFHQNTEFRLINFFGTNYTESQFRAALADDTIIITTFDVSNISYSENPNDSDYATVTADVHIEAAIGGVDNVGDFTVTHNIRKTWQTYETTLS